MTKHHYDYQRKTDDEIAELAKRVYRNEVFVSWMIDRPGDLPFVFIPLSLIDESTRQGMIENEIQFVYEDYLRAGPIAFNGHPIFYSFSCLNKEDGHRLQVKIKEIADLIG
jgi:hypothetical protein